jgi:hypothetical protein
LFGTPYCYFSDFVKELKKSFFMFADAVLRLTRFAVYFVLYPAKNKSTVRSAEGETICIISSFMAAIIAVSLRSLK